MNKTSTATKQTSRTKSGAKPASKLDLRFILKGSGEFLYISPDCMALMDVEGHELCDVVPRNVLNFASADDVLNETKDDFVSSIRSGAHTVICGTKQKAIEFQFDWVQTGEGLSYLIASAQAPGVPQKQSELNQFLSTVVATPKTPLSTASSSVLRAEELHEFLQISNDLMCSMHQDGGIVRFNAAFGERLGYAREEMIGKTFSDFIEPVDRALIHTCLSNLCHGGETQELQIRQECRMATASAETRWVDWTFRTLGSTVYCLGRDVTDAKRHEQALLGREQQLSEAQALARMGHWRWDVGATEIEWSCELYNIFGVDHKTFVPTIDSINDLVHRRDLGHLYQAFQRAIIQQNDYDMEFRLMRDDGDMRNIRCEGRCELDAEGEVIALYGIMQDVTSQKEHERDLREAKEAAESAYASKSRFLANMSHELRTPLNAIIGFSDLISKQLLGPLGDERYLDYIGGIRESGQHLLDLITDILDMSKIEAGKYELTLEKINIASIISATAQMMEARAIDAGLDLKCILPEFDVVIEADRRAVKQILLNLLSNAIKFTQNGGAVTVTLQSDDQDSITIEIRDSGIGIPAHKLSDVTKPFEQASNAFTRQHEGSGLGLAITKDLTALHGGEMQIVSRLNVGTTVSVKLPRIIQSAG